MTPLSVSHLPPGTPGWVFGVVVGALTLHIGAGSIGALSGAAALSVRKGERLHRLFGTVFFVSMLVMAAMGAGLAVLIAQINNVAGGILAFYLVATAWMTVRQKEGTTGLFDKMAFAVVLSVSAAFLIWGLQAAASPKGRLYGYPATIYYVIASFAAFIGALDLKVILRGGISGVPRLTRHLWRMCLALSLAVASFIGQQQKLLAAFLPRAPVLLVLGFVPLVVMIFWLIRIRVSRQFRSAVQST